MLVPSSPGVQSFLPRQSEGENKKESYFVCNYATYFGCTVYQKKMVRYKEAVSTDLLQIISKDEPEFPEY